MGSNQKNPPFIPVGSEHQETVDARVEDIAYTINHSLVCSVVDVAGAPVANWTEKHLGFRVALPGHDHGHDHAHGNLASWFIGEVIGDYVAVPVTVAFQRLAPGFMNGLRMLMEPLLGPLFRMGARHSAQNWAIRHGLATDSSRARERERQIYEHEVRHLPQALMWTASSTTINIGIQYAIESNRLFGTHMHGNLKQWLWGKSAGKLAASAMTAGVVVGFRGLKPQAAEQWDRWTGKHVFLPMTESIGHLFGVKKEDVERMNKKRDAAEKGAWAARVVAPTGPGRTVG